MARKSTISLPGSVSVLVPPDEDIHAVGNYGRELAISVHVYGADIGVLGSSVNRTFPDDLVRQDDWSGSPVSWRALEHDLARAG